MVAPAPSRIAYYPALDGLRGIAVATMLVYHSDVSFIGGGYLSVSTFFTLSGFLITALLLVESATRGGIDMKRFWARRLRRLMPAALLGIALAALFAFVAGTSSQLWRIRWDGLASLFYFANFRFMSVGHSYWEMFNRPSPLQHYWSLSIEEQFYLVYPPLVILTAALARRGRDRTGLVLVLLTLLSTAAMIGLSLGGAAPSRLYYGTDTRAAEFLVGGVLATFLVRGGRIEPWRGRGYGIATLAAMAYVLAALALVEEDSDFLYRGGFALYAVATALIVNAGLQPSLVRTVLSWWPWQRLGVMSYGVYIYHWPIFLWLDEQRTGLGGVSLFALRTASTLGLATVSYFALELPIRERRWLHGLPARLAAPVAALATAALLVKVSTDVPHAPGHDPARIAEMPALRPPFPEGPLRVMVVGDSVAMNVGAGFVALGKRAPGALSVWNVAQYGCGIARVGRTDLSVNDAELCDAWPDRWEAAVERFRPNLVVVLTGVWDLRDRVLPASREVSAPGDPDFDAWLVHEYQLAVDIVSSRGARVIWLTAPCIGPVPARNPLRGTGALSGARVDYLNRVLLPALAASRPGRVQIVDLFGRLCPGGEFLEYDARLRKLRTDYLHIGFGASREIASWILSGTFPQVLQRKPPAQSATLADAR